MENTHSPKLHLWTSPYGPLCNVRGCPLPTSWIRLLQALWGPPSPFPRYRLIFNSKRGVSYRHPDDVLKTSLHGSISKAKKRPRHRDFCIWSASINVIWLKWPPRNIRLTIRKEGIWIACYSKLLQFSENSRKEPTEKFILQIRNLQLYQNRTFLQVLLYYCRFFCMIVDIF